ncbi:tetratricopeptide repeat protein [Chenggangzhangella methanolivorans]|uniref:Tetratricopeptide repeat protein n=2 Tax=Chenggangzhangella methanolivorans TaxID=1437009 RepID=A0A9E6R7Y3_9HYPH|nr:tetratricopeptide repeat protein [Chenggangzhangella methanolivorans]QZN98302.1 tetratricopeptide repeat protein [Chenggangzhangella methanolivorans]
MIRAVSAALALLMASAAAAQTPPAPPSADVTGPSAPAKSLEDPDTRRKAADDLLGRLAKTEDATSAKRIAAAVQALWLRSGSDTVDLLTSRAGEAQRAQKLDVAIKLMDEVVSLRPDFVEGWNRRATLRYVAKDYDEAMADIHEVLIREPRHFGAWIGLGRILSDAGFDAKALAAYRKALEIYPAVENLKKQVDELALKVEGQPI